MMRISEVVWVSCEKLTKVFNQLDEMGGLAVLAGMEAFGCTKVVGGFPASLQFLEGNCCQFFYVRH